MKSRFAAAIILTVAAALPAPAIIQRTVPLKDVLAGEPFIFAAKVGKLDIAGMAMGIEVGEYFKARFPYPGFTVDLHGDAEAKKTKQSEQLIARLKPGLDMMVFGSVRNSKTTLYAYTNGTWFQITG